MYFYASANLTGGMGPWPGGGDPSYTRQGEDYTRQGEESRVAKKMWGSESKEIVSGRQ